MIVMHRSMRISQTLLSLLFLLFLVPSLLLAEVVGASGVGSSEDAAMENAKKNGLRRKIERTIGQATYDKHETRIESIFIDNYRSYILSASPLESRSEFGVISVRARLEFSDSRIDQILNEEGIISVSESKPRIMIVLDEKVGNESSTDKTASFALERILTRAGFTVVESEQMEQIQEQERALQMNQDALATLAFRSGADLILKGNVSVGAAQEQNLYGIINYLVPVQMNIRVVRADNAEVVVSQSKSIREPGGDEFSAIRSGLTKGGESIGGLIANQLLDLWKKDLAAPKRIELMATGTTFDAVETALDTLPEIMSSNLRYLEDQSALYDIILRGTVQDLRESLGDIPGWRITLMTANRIGIGSSSAPQREVEYSYSEPDIAISDFTIDAIFPSRGRFYESNPLASVTINLAPGASVQNLTVSAIIPEVMDLASEVQLAEIGSGNSETVDLVLLMSNQKLLANREERRVTGQVTVSFYQNGKQVTRQLSVPVTLHDANAMDWADASSIGAFVTYRNSTVDMFARQSVIAVDKTGFNDQFESAVAIFTTLKTYGITYVKDPISAGDARVLDKVQFPLETLEKKSGDCDDSSVLIASLLSAVGIDVAFISYPDHVLIMFDTGIYEKNRDKLGADSDAVIIHNGRCWIPVETTLLRENFLTAWSTAAEEFHQAVADGQPIEISELAVAWNNYPPFNYSRTNDAIVAPQVGDSIMAALDEVENQLQADIEQQIAALQSKPNRSSADLNRMGVLFARSGDYTKAVSHYTGISTDGSNYVYDNNLGCALILSGDEVRGLEFIEKSIASQPTAGAQVNKALAYYLMSNTPEGIEKFLIAMDEANRALPEGTSLEQLLGIELAEGNGDRASEHEAEKEQTIDRRRLQELLRKRVVDRDLSHEAKEQGVTANVNVMPFGGVRGADPTQVATITDLLFWLEM